MEVPAPPWIELPTDLTANILGRLDVEDILDSAQKVCTTWWNVCKHHSDTWRVITMKNARRGLIRTRLPSMCRRAVDLSRGRLIELNLDGFGKNKLLNYVADRSSNLKRLQLNSCIDINEGLAEAAKKLPQLEELHLIVMFNVPPEAIEAIGNSCPKLKSFTYNFNGTPIYISDNDGSGFQGCNNYARAISNSMPNLLHLRLCGDWMNKEGLEAILDGCPRLESLDLRQCYWLDLGGDLGRRCSKQIKALKRPSDSVRDVSWLTDKQEEDGDQSYDYDFSRYDFTLPGFTRLERTGPPVPDNSFERFDPDFPDDSFECFDPCCYDYERWGETKSHLYVWIAR